MLRFLVEALRFLVRMRDQACLTSTCLESLKHFKMLTLSENAWILCENAQIHSKIAYIFSEIAHKL